MPNLRHSFVSAKPDGTDTSVLRPRDWNAKLQYTDSSGAPSGTDAIVRRQLTADETFYVSTTGNDSASGTISSPWRTLQNAYSTILNTVDSGGNYNVTIKIADGTYAGVCLDSVIPGDPLVTFQGNTSSPSAVTIQGEASGSGCDGVFYFERGKFALAGMTIVGDGTAVDGIHASVHSRVFLGASLRFGSASNAHIDIDTGSYVFSDGDYTIVGGTAYHVGVADSSLFQRVGGTVTLTGTPTFSYAFAYAYNQGIVAYSSDTFSGSATGPRFRGETGGVLISGDGTQTFFPGDSAGIMDGTAIYDSVQPLASYAKASLPSAAPAAKMIYVTDETGGATPAFSDGSNWRRVADRAVVS